MEIPESVKQLDNMLKHERIDRLKPVKVLKVLYELSSCQQITQEWRAEARKAGALLKNVIRTKNSISIFEILLIISGTPLGVEVNRRIIFYATQPELHRQNRVEDCGIADNSPSLLAAFKASKRRR